MKIFIVLDNKEEVQIPRETVDEYKLLEYKEEDLFDKLRQIRWFFIPSSEEDQKEGYIGRYIHFYEIKRVFITK